MGGRGRQKGDPAVESGKAVLVEYLGSFNDEVLL